MSYSKGKSRGWLTRPGFLALLASFMLGIISAPPACAQALGWEGETGVFVTPLAFTASDPEGQTVHPVVAYHYLNGGPVIGDFHEVSIEVGVGKRFELGYTHEFHVFGSDPNLSPLWQNGFEIFNAKAILIPENSWNQKWLPAISLGFIARTDVRNVGNWVAQSANSSMVSGKSDGDIYGVASKVIPTKPIAIILSGGVRGTDAELWGMAGNTPNWQARAFGAVAFAFSGPERSSIILATEAAQQPHHPYDFPTLSIPTTLTYAVRFVPSPKYHLNFDFGIAQIAGQVMPGVNLEARHQAAVQVSYGF